MLGSLRQNSEANLLLLLLLIGPMLSNTALHLRISGGARSPRITRDRLVINPLVVTLTSLNQVLRTRTRGRTAVLPSLNDLIRIRRKIGSSSTRMPKVKARLLTKYPSLMKLLWNRSWNMSKKIFFLLASYKHRKTMTWETHLPLLHTRIEMKKTVG